MELNLSNGYKLSTDRAESSYGMPVLVAPNGQALGAKDRAPESSGELGWLDSYFDAESIVAGMVHADGASADLADRKSVV